jgi:hypothetical protein
MRVVGDPNEHRSDCFACKVSLAPGQGIWEMHTKTFEYILVCRQKLHCAKRKNRQDRPNGAFGKRSFAT